MPDCHEGKDCIVGLSLTINDKVNPSLIGPDIGCGMFVVKLKEKELDFKALDNFIRNSEILKSARSDKTKHKYIKYIDKLNLKCAKQINLSKSMLTFGTLGGGNHFIEIDKDGQDNLYLVIHTGSRHLGGQVAKHYTKLAMRTLVNNKYLREDLINKLIAEGKNQIIQEELEIPKRQINKGHAYLERNDSKDYINDMYITQWFAEMNREAIADDISVNKKIIETAIADINALCNIATLAGRLKNFSSEALDKWLTFRIWRYLYWRLNETTKSVEECRILVNYIYNEFPYLIDTLKEVAVKRFGEKVVDNIKLN
jgi:RNA-splicing ligase RtcB